MKLFSVFLLLCLPVFAITACSSGGGGGNGGDTGPAPEDNRRTVDAAGGTLTFDNGIVLEIPANAVAGSTEIQVDLLDCAATESILKSVVFQSHQKSCLGGFSAEPDGLTFALPVTATVPVRALEPGEIPIQVELDYDTQGLRIAPTDVFYHSADDVVEIRNLQHFSESWLVTYHQFVEDNCRTCATYGAIPEFCDAYAKDFWGGLQSGCCLLLRSERNACSAGCDCCMEDVHSESAGMDVTPTAVCLMAGIDIKTTFPKCAGSPTLTDSISEMTEECKDLTMELKLQPTALEMYACESKLLNSEILATLTGKKADGSVEFGPLTIEPNWTSANTAVASVTGDGMVTANMAGITTLHALISRDPAMPSAQAALNVLSNISAVNIEWCPLQLEIDEVGLLQANVELAPGRGLVDYNNLNWSSSAPTVAPVTPAGELASVAGLQRGTSTITAAFTYDCETKSANCDVSVECRPLTLTVEPSTAHLLVDVEMHDSTLLAADLLDAITGARALDEEGTPLDLTITWSSADENVVGVMNPIGPQTAAEAVRPSTAPVTVSATYDDGCQKKQAHAAVTVACVDLELTFTAGKINGYDTLPIGVRTVDDKGNPVEIDPELVTWSSSAPHIASVTPSSTPLWATIYGLSEGTATIRASYDEGSCGLRMANAYIEVTRTFAGHWNLIPTDQIEWCRYNLGEWWEEDPFTGFDIWVSQPRSDDKTYIESTFNDPATVTDPDKEPTLSGTWNAETGVFTLATDTTDLEQCGYLFYNSDICGAAENCTLVACQNTTDISGVTSKDLDDLTADTEWYYSVTFSYGPDPGDPSGYTTWECQGNASLHGDRL